MDMCLLSFMFTNIVYMVYQRCDMIRPLLKSAAIALQFGMLIEFLFEKFPNFEDVNETAVGDLQVRNSCF